MAEFLTRAFFEEELDNLIQEFAAENEGCEVSVHLLLRGAPPIKIEGKPVCGESYIKIRTRDGGKEPRMIILPCGTIIGISLSSESKTKKVGFNS